MTSRLILASYRLREQTKSGKDPHWCEYCGMPADTLDHFLPVVFTNSLAPLLRLPSGLRVCRCCRECNTLAGSALFDTFTEKREFIKRKLRHKYMHLLAIPHWEESEINELEGNLRRSLVRDLELKALVLSRLSWPRDNLTED